MADNNATGGWLNNEQYEDLKAAIGASESGGNYKAREAARGNYIGKYQLGVAALLDLGYIKTSALNPTSSSLNLSNASIWTGKNGITGVDAFLNSPATQEAAMDSLVVINMARMQASNTINLAKTPKAIGGFIAVAHLLGATGARRFADGTDGADANGTTGTRYFKLGQDAVAGSMPRPSGPGGSYAPEDQGTSGSNGVRPDVQSGTTVYTENPDAATDYGDTTVDDPNEVTYAPGSMQQLLQSLNFDGPRNPISRFRSVSYHFVLYMCANATDAAEVGKQSLSDTFQTARSLFQHTNETTDPLYGKYHVRTVGKDVGEGAVTVDDDGNPIADTSGAAKYVVLINTFTDADFTIDDIELTTATVGGMSPTSSNTGQGTSRSFSELAQDIKLRVFEPHGARLLDVLVQAMLKFGVGVSAFYGLKFFFVGHTDDNTDVTYAGLSSSQNIGHFYATDPVIFFMDNITSKFSHKGGEYNMHGLCTAGGHIPSIDAGKSVSFTVPDNPTIKQVVDAMCEKLTQQAAKVNAELGIPSGKPIVYRAVFTDYAHDEGLYPSRFETYPVDNIKSTQRSTNGVTFVTDPNKSLTDQAQQIWMSSASYTDQISRLASSNEGAQDRYGLISASLTFKDGAYTSPVRTIHVIRRPVPFLGASRSVESSDDNVDIASEQQNTRTAGIEKAVLDAIRRGGFFYYQYLFSGKNVDLLDFDLSIDESVGVAATWYAAKMPMTQAEQINGKPEASTIVSQQRNLVPSQAHYQPPPSVKGDAYRSANSPSASTSFYEFLNVQMGFFQKGPVSATIRGNPYLLARALMTEDTINAPYVAPAATVPADNNEISMPPLSQMSPLVKIDVYMPPPGWEVGQPLTIDRSLKCFRQNFWYDGVYILQNVVHKFKGGKFTQELSLMPIASADSKTTQAERGSSVPAKPSTATAPPNTTAGNESWRKPGSDKNKATTPASNLIGDTLNSSAYFSNTSISGDMVLTKDFTIASLTTRPAVTHQPIGAANGRTIGRVARNLHLLAANCVQPIKDKYPNMIITSGLRRPTGSTSDHPNGCAFDFQLPVASGSPQATIDAVHLEAAQWCATLPKFFQVIIEYQEHGTRKPIIHVAYREGEHKRQTLTLVYRSANGKPQTVSQQLVSRP